MVRHTAPSPPLPPAPRGEEEEGGEKYVETISPVDGSCIHRACSLLHYDVRTTAARGGVLGEYNDGNNNDKNKNKIMRDLPPTSERATMRR